MSDFMLEQREDGTYDLAIKSYDFKLDNGLEPSVIISLHIDSRATIEEIRSNQNENFLGGFWASVISEISFGSKLWLFYREKLTEDLPTRMEEAIKNSLQWMIDHGIASEILVSSERGAVGGGSITTLVEIKRPQDKEDFRYQLNWEAA